MADEALGRDWHLVAFDMPCHGRSRPPDGWAGEPWQLDTAGYLAAIRAWMQATGTPQVALAGCSMGSAIGLAFLAQHREHSLGAILLETPYRSPGRRTDLLDHPAVHGGRFGAAWVQALLSPHSPAAGRRFATWLYSQSAPGVYEGDLAFYSDEFDAMHHAPGIDTARTPLWLMTGEYDYSATPADSRRVADAVPGAHFQEMKGLGHFPMTEHPERLLEYFRPAAHALREHPRRMETAK
jgi:pimeloyl-ACP methyl ester carboxylesterase